jgi:hypothetical protein|nr:hypothetical protein [uncultured Steroidobacter sp.]
MRKLAVKSALIVGALGAVCSLWLSLSQPPTSGALLLLGTTFHAVATFLMLFVISLIPMPGALLVQRVAPRLPVALASVLSLLSGLLIVFLLLSAIEQPTFETDGVTSVYRHAGPSLNASRNSAYYLYAMTVMCISLSIFYLLRWRSGCANKALG